MFAPKQKCASALKKATTSELSCADHPGPWTFTNDTGTFPEPGSSGITCADYGAPVKGVAKVPCTATAKAYCPKACEECVACDNLFECMQECTQDANSPSAVKCGMLLFACFSGVSPTPPPRCQCARSPPPRAPAARRRRAV